MINTITMGQHNNLDIPWIELVAAVFKQAAKDYKTTMDWLESHPTKLETIKGKKVIKLRDDVLQFTESDLFLMSDIDPDMFLGMALNGEIRMCHA